MLDFDPHLLDSEDPNGEAIHKREELPRIEEVRELHQFEEQSGRTGKLLINLLHFLPHEIESHHASLRVRGTEQIQLVEEIHELGQALKLSFIQKLLHQQTLVFHQRAKLLIAHLVIPQPRMDLRVRDEQLAVLVFLFSPLQHPFQLLGDEMVHSQLQDLFIGLFFLLLAFGLVFLEDGELFLVQEIDQF